MATPPHGTSEATLERLIACSVDQRLHNVRYRQRQLLLLHQFLRQHSAKICDLIMQDSGHSREESWLEFSLTLIKINKLYEQLDFDDALKREYSVSRNESYIDCRAPHGIALIRPGSYTAFYSIFSATAAALAAGNCVVVQTTSEKPSALVSFFIEGFTVLDHDVFAILTTEPEPVLLSQCFVIEQTNLDQGGGDLAPLLPYTIAVVDRTADIQQAAQALCTARFSFKGKSPYAPDLVLVNEWVMQVFLQACVRELGGDPNNLKSAGALPKPGSDFTGTGETSIFRIGESEVIYDASRRKLERAAGGPLRLIASTGLISTITEASQYGTLLAGYYFGDSKTCKFLHQSLDSKIAFINNIPLSILVGPIRPETELSPIQIDTCYDLMIMSKPKPVFVFKSNDSNLLSLNARDFCLRELKRSKTQRLQSLEQLAMQPLRAIQQHSGSGSGFFDQGIMTGLIAFVLPTVVVLGWAVFRGGKYLWALY
ncbi:hypothetical protein FOQG_14459 [Fusarium oxysporum f. sp. raphani 54005]|uniref:Aldehyde dehydrogenase domain-containing protein n=3 Tax=Fusarium oxysporum TaxID=5507 RepID=X0BRB8_FUSOX|nr:hypothetical protein FOVG_14732 [Fusarium oxysporum f. sp. pisi HDV247]EXK81029.1 hypothetical protein FOQG_14459 [Fusarium oxysporum f. sp. raphani 54005]